jgi:hypothetical protein
MINSAKERLSLLSSQPAQALLLQKLQGCPGMRGIE